MKKVVLVLLTSFITCNLYSQTLSTADTSDWNKVYQSGFYQALVENSQNNPPNSSGWFWGINTAHTTNNPNYRFNGQIIFRVNIGANVVPMVYVRSTNQQGEGIWAKILHSKGDHAIDGKLTANEVQIKVNTGADFVFDPNYPLAPLSQVESFIKENKHLPEIPSEKEMIENGVSVNEMQIKLLQKIEELTLYVIDLKKENQEQNNFIEEQNKQIKELQEKNK